MNPFAGSRITPTMCQRMLCVLAAALAGCAHIRNPVPVEAMNRAEVVGFPGIRAWSEHVEPIQNSLAESIRQALRHDPRGTLDETGRYNVLTISGGGANGAFGAGLLCGWTESGTRPTFKMVTGISTGALIAPFAFAGPKYDATLKRFYTTVSSKDILIVRPLIQIAFGAESVAETAPLARLLEQCIDPTLLADIAAEHGKGRRLFVGTTNLDTGRLVVWDMGAIAGSARPEALGLFRKIMLASASIPIAFPPQYFAVEADGRAYDEMHVDGGVMVQAFLYGVPVDVEALRREAGPLGDAKGRIYVIRNGQVLMPPEHTAPKLSAIAERSITGFIDAQAIGDIFRLHAIARQDDMEFKLAHIPAEFKFEGKELFDREDMKRLFEMGYRMALAGYPWQQQPPAFDVPRM